MGVVWHEGSLYVGPHGAVYWARLKNRSASDGNALYTAAYLGFMPTQVNNPDLDLPTPNPNPGWATYGELRVMAWNGGKADL